jgi:hypothetical protein
MGGPIFLKNIHYRDAHAEMGEHEVGAIRAATEIEQNAIRPKEQFDVLNVAILSGKGLGLNFLRILLLKLDEELSDGFTIRRRHKGQHYFFRKEARSHDNCKPHIGEAPTETAKSFSRKHATTAKPARHVDRSEYLVARRWAC